MNPRRGGGGGDAPHLTLGCELQILVSIRVFRTESHYILPIQLSIRAVHEEISQKCSVHFSMDSFRGQFKLEPQPH